MPHSYTFMPPPPPQRETLTALMAGIGMAFEAEPDPSGNIEDVLLWASEDGMLREEMRTLSVLTTWLEVHHARLRADRLVRIVRAHQSPRVRAYWAAVGQWLKKDVRLAKLVPLAPPHRTELLEAQEFWLGRHGEDLRFEAGPLLAPRGALRERSADAAAPEVVVHLHQGYLHRVILGSGARADAWTVLRAHPGFSAAQVATHAYCSFSTAWAVHRDFTLAHTTPGAASLAS